MMMVSSSTFTLSIERSVCRQSWLLKLNGTMLEALGTRREAQEQLNWYKGRLGL